MASHRYPIHVSDFYAVSMATCCIVRTDHVGDLVLCTGFIDAIAKRYVTDVVVPSGAGQLLEHCPTVRHVYALPQVRQSPESGVQIKRGWEASAPFLNRKYDLVINAVSSRSQMSDKVIRSMSAARRAGFVNDTANQYNPKHNKLYKPLVAVLHPLEPELKRYARMLQALSIHDHGEIAPNMHTSWADTEHAASLLPSGARVIAVSPEARHRHRQWPERMWNSWLDSLAKVYPDIHVAWIGKDGGGYQLRHPRLIDLLGKTNLTQIAAIMSLVDMWIGSEAGPSHIAAAADRSKVVQIIGGAHFGRFFPVDSAGDHVATRRPDCFMCGDWFKCDRNFECVYGIPFDSVWERTVEILGGKGLDTRLPVIQDDYPIKQGIQVVPINLIDPYDSVHQPREDARPPFWCQNAEITSEHWNAVREVQKMIRRCLYVRPIAVNGRKRMDGFARYMAYRLMGRTEILVDNSVRHRPGQQDGRGWLLGKDEQKGLVRTRRREWETCLRFWQR